MPLLKKFVVVLIFVVLVALAVYGWSWSWPAMTRPYATTAAPKLSTVSNNGGLVVTFWTGSSRVYEKSVHIPVRIDLLFENRSSSSIKDLRFIDFRAPGFEESADGKCWADHHPSCSSEEPGELTGPIELGAGKSKRVWADLFPAVSTGRFGFLAVYGWSQQIPLQKKSDPGPISVAHSGSVSLPAIEITSPLREAVGTHIRLLQSLAIPIVVGLLAAIFQRIDKARSERAEVWKEQLGRIFEYTKDHYLGIGREVQNLEIYYASRSFDRVPYHFLMFWIRMRLLRNSKGGWFLSTTESEKLLAATWGLLFSHVQVHFGDMELEKAMDELKGVVVSPSEYGSALKGTGAGAAILPIVDANFRLWAAGTSPKTGNNDSFRQALALLSILKLVLKYEWDRPFFRYWYGHADDFEMDQYKVHLQYVPHSPPTDYADFEKAEKAYSAAL